MLMCMLTLVLFGARYVESLSPQFIISLIFLSSLLLKYESTKHNFKHPISLRDGAAFMAAAESIQIAVSLLKQDFVYPICHLLSNSSGNMLYEESSSVVWLP